MLHLFNGDIEIRAAQHRQLLIGTDGIAMFDEQFFDNAFLGRENVPMLDRLQRPLRLQFKTRREKTQDEKDGDNRAADGNRLGQVSRFGHDLRLTQRSPKRH